MSIDSFSPHGTCKVIVVKDMHGITVKLNTYEYKWCLRQTTARPPDR